jgi:uncharacterized protein YciI
MNKLPIILLVLIPCSIYAQSNSLDFLKGSWKMENKEVYEHWDQLENGNLKGFSYELKSGQMSVYEYLDISTNKNKTIYKATVLYQNSGKGIKFKMTKNDSILRFENPKHSFPKKISYHKINAKEILIKLEGEPNQEISYKIQKISNNINKDTAIQNPNYDKTLASNLGGDEYGMKSYILVILKTGTNYSTDNTQRSNSFKGHMDNINKLVEDGKLIVAGPIEKNEKTYRGIFILNVDNFEEAKKLLEGDQAVRNKYLDYYLFKWYGSAALPEYLKASDKIWKIKP